MAADVRLAGPDDVAAVGRTLGRAFRDDPVFRWLAPQLDDDQRARRCQPFFAAEARVAARQATAWTSSGHTGAALWGAPGRWRASGLDAVRIALAITRGARWRTPKSVASLAVLEKQHPREPHWYLGFLGTDPDHRGEGIGVELLRPVLARCDHDGLPAYLESSKAENVPYYERFGWHVQREVALKDGPTLWLMWRDPS